MPTVRLNAAEQDPNPAEQNSDSTTQDAPGDYDNAREVDAPEVGEVDEHGGMDGQDPQGPR